MDSSGCLNFCRKRFNENIVHCLYVMDVAGEMQLGTKNMYPFLLKTNSSFDDG